MARLNTGKRERFLYPACADAGPVPTAPVLVNSLVGKGAGA
ncbi:hypothetical protein SAMN04488539_1626 [Corynebacterium timonense]|uniref:Uncharacterized protein n=1 Tax=Corynebacterium timonense TaxID=441500 RepID=A0A1H1S0E9_9CORY|nr:hypothetical protein SAMN04488539_1626 [Corynebacterium timonense]